MGGCATKPKVLQDEAEAPQPAEEQAAVATVADTVTAEAGEEEKEEVKAEEAAEAADGRKSLHNLFTEKEAEESATGSEETAPNSSPVDEVKAAGEAGSDAADQKRQEEAQTEETMQ
ncbi:hypothetical protein AXF42_Ash011679 [Apostasia shenzhenica]|uniref:Uncharacterized protein n=1 Tax=Apostasia shenzhenica TaxID=1088818 RepID=A0A2H9ZUM9_9ASPA|nr:hypothetical protein AXF42_Ash011679 [Apostasia shenzhenica]